METYEKAAAKFVNKTHAQRKVSGNLIEIVKMENFDKKSKGIPFGS